MAPITKSEIEKTLLKGLAFEWTDATSKKASMLLGKQAQRRLFKFLLSSKVREPTGLPEAFISDLHAAFDAADDPAQIANAAAADPSHKGSWRLHSIETEGFGGLNIWKCAPFTFSFDSHSYLIEGPNGSGKSSLTGAIIWALTGEKPRDQSPALPHAPKPVLGKLNEKPIGEWPPIATYPPTVAQLTIKPSVRVTLTFKDDTGTLAKIERRLVGSKVECDWDQVIDIPTALLETGLLMPARLGTIRLDDGGDTLTNAIQKLTGLDDLAAIGLLCEGLCHASREYRSFRKKELAAAVKDFDTALQDARRALQPVNVNVDAFTPADTADKNGAMAKFGAQLKTTAQELTSVISNDLSPTLDLSQPSTQTRVTTNVSNASAAISLGLPGFKFWQTLTALSTHLNQQAYEALQQAVGKARQDWTEAHALHERAIKDSRFQLKALAAQWHAKHQPGPIDACPLCTHDLSADPQLAAEMATLQTLGEAASRSYVDSLNRISSSLTAAVPQQLRKYLPEILDWEPRSQLVGDIATSLGSASPFSTVLKTLTTLVENGSTNAPAKTLPTVGLPNAKEEDKALVKQLATAERLLVLKHWSGENIPLWEKWWTLLSGIGQPHPEASVENPAPEGPESLSVHIARLTDALERAGPYRLGAEFLGKAWTAGVNVRKIEVDTKKREAVAEALAPLKNLGSLSDSIAGDAITRLSKRIGTLLQDIHISENLRFSDAQLHRKEGFVVHAEFDPELRLDATLVANTSWLRAVLWAFVFALREEAVKLAQSDSFPFMLFDDPQATFDFAHRHRWAGYIASLQADPTKIQVILTSHDEAFIRLIKVSGVSGRDAMIVSAGKEFAHITILEGEHLEREWVNASTLGTPKAAQDYMNAARIYVEGMLKLMLRGEISAPDTYVLGSCRERISILHKQGGGVSPWNRSEMGNLVAALDKKKPQIIHMEIAHHADGAQLAIAEATDVRAHLTSKLLPTLDHCFRLVRQNLSLHAGQKALHKPAPIIPFPEGHRDSVRNLQFKIWGRVAALTSGLAADGLLSLDEYAEHAHEKVTLAQHAAYLLSSQTLEPVADTGDILLALEQDGCNSPALVIAIDHDRILARRYIPAAHDTDIAVLSAQTINPYELSPPVVAQKATLAMRKIVGVIYGAGASQGLGANSEVQALPGDGALVNLSQSILGLVEVMGRSAEPYALNGQYLILQKAIPGLSALKTHEGRPVIAIDSDGNRYFKRLHVGSDRVVLESLATGGAFAPVILQMPGTGANSLSEAWPVLGVLFDVPGK